MCKRKMPRFQYIPSLLPSLLPPILAPSLLLRLLRYLTPLNTFYRPIAYLLSLPSHYVGNYPSQANVKALRTAEGWAVPDLLYSLTANVEVNANFRWLSCCLLGLGPWL